MQNVLERYAKICSYGLPPDDSYLNALEEMGATFSSAEGTVHRMLYAAYDAARLELHPLATDTPPKAKPTATTLAFFKDLQRGLSHEAMAEEHGITTDYSRTLLSRLKKGSYEL